MMSQYAENRDEANGQSLDNLCGMPMDPGNFLRLALEITRALAGLHTRNIIHKDIRPENIFVNLETGAATISDTPTVSQPRHQRSAIQRPGRLEGALAYMSPEQMGRINRVVDYRTDLYSLGVTFYEMLAGTLPFKAGDALEWVHCHIARLPQPPANILPYLPTVVSDIVMKLLSKNAEERYQTARGLEFDLERCLEQWEEKSNIDPFPLAQWDIADRLLIPQKLYGREKDIDILFSAFDRVLKRGNPELVMIAGYSGIGKTSLVRELYKPVVREHGLFIWGKFDQYKRDIPYSTIVEAFQELVRQVLTENENRLTDWREQLRETLGVNGQLIVDIIPQVELIIGKQPQVPELPLSEAENRFNMVFRQFMGVFTKKEHPLVLFLDDLQWVDPASLRLIEHIITYPDIRHLLLIGAYRDNEVSPSHPLMLTLEHLHNFRASFGTITLSPLSFKDLSRFTADTFRSDQAQVEPLARLVYEKTAGNPFFVTQFLMTLQAGNLLEFDGKERCWKWDISRIREQGYSDNVVDLMVEKLNRLSYGAQQTLRLAACIGNRFDLHTLAMISNTPEEDAQDALLEALEKGLLLRETESLYTFLHDRVQQAAYSLIPEEQRSAVHLQIARLLLDRTPSGVIDEKVFDIVNQFNLGVALIDDQEERYRVAGLDLVAGKKAKASTAYASALSYLSLGIMLLDDATWESHYDLTFNLYKELAEVEYLNSNYVHSKELIDLLLSKAKSDMERAELYNILIVQYTLMAQYGDAIQSGRKALQLLNVSIPEINLEEELSVQIAKYKEILGNRKISSLIDEPEMSDPKKRVSLELLSNMVVPARYTDSVLFALISVINVNLSLKFGPTAKSTVGYTAFGMVLNSVMNNYRDAYEFGELSLKISERFNALSQKCQSCFMLGHYLNHWVKHLKWADDVMNDGFMAGMASGEMQWTGYTLAYKLFQPFYRGVQIGLIQKEIPALLSFTQQTKNQWATDTLLGLKLALSNLDGNISSSKESEGDFDAAYENKYLAECGDHRSFGAKGRYAVLKAQILYLYGRMHEALKAVSMAQELLGFFSSSISVAELNFYHSLILAALHDDSSDRVKRAYLDRIRANQEPMKTWVAHCEENFKHQYLLVEAEIARISGKELEAGRLYEQSIQSARENGFVQDEGIANELASRFYSRHGLKTVADVYLRKAIACYGRWGAERKLSQLGQQNPWLLQEEKDAFGQGFKAQIGHLDAITVVKASQAISGEIVLSSLLETLMRTVIENAGAQKGFLILAHGNDLVIEAKARVEGQEIKVLQPAPSQLASVLPLSVVNYVWRTGESVILDDASDQTMFSSDEYIVTNRPISVLCLPLLRQAHPIGMLYLENSLTKGAFTTGRIAVLELLAAQAAVSLENAALYLERSRAEDALRESEEKYRAIFENSGTALIFVEEDMTISICNKEFERLSGYTKMEVEGLMKWPELVAKEDDLERMKGYHRLRRIDQGEAPQTYEFQFIDRERKLKDVVITVATMPGKKQSLALIRDITQEARLERELRQAHKMEAIGTLAGGIAHDFNNILTAIIGYTDMVHSKVPEGSEEKRQLEQVLKAGSRATDLVRQILAFSRQSEHERKPVQVAPIVKEALKLLRSSLPSTIEIREYISVAPEESVVLADSTQIHQVLMNLATNAAHAMRMQGGVLSVQLSEVEADGSLVSLYPELKPGPYVRVTVSDTGHGVNATVMERIFDPYFTTKDQGEGSGMGLAVVQGIVKSHCGAIMVYSEPGKGSTFHVYLPKIEERAQTEAEVPEELPGGHERILFVDDEKSLVSLGEDMLESLGYNVTAKTSSLEAMEIFHARPNAFDLVVTDMTMPALTGIELAKKFMAIRPDIPIILCTGFSELINEKQSKELGIREFVMKPYVIATFAKTIRRVLDED